MAILTVGIDLAKNVFAVHGVDESGTAQLRQPKVARGKLNALVASLPPCVIGIEACSGAHYWARLWRVNLDERRATIWMRTVSRRLDDARALIVAGVI